MDEADRAEINKLHNDSKALIDTLENRLPPERLEDLREYSFAGEWGLLVDTMFATLTKRQIPVTAIERDALVAILDQMPTPRPNYKFINDKEKIIAALNVID